MVHDGCEKFSSIVCFEGKKRQEWGEKKGKTNSTISHFIGPSHQWNGVDQISQST